MKYYQCLDKDCKEIFSEDNAYRLFWDNKLVALKCPYCRGFIEEISEAIGIADKERKEQGFEKYKQEYKQKYGKEYQPCVLLTDIKINGELIG